MKDEKPIQPKIIEIIENDPYLAKEIKTPAWDKFKDALIKVYNLDRD